MRSITFLLLLINVSVWGQRVTKGDCMQGQGTFEYEDGSSYTGEWNNGSRSGKGKITYAKGVKEKTLSAGPVILSVYAQGTKNQVQEFINGYNENSLILNSEEYDDDNYFTTLAEKVGTEYKHDITRAQGYYKVGISQINIASLTDEAKHLIRLRHKRNYLKAIIQPNNSDCLEMIKGYSSAIHKKNEAEKLQAEADHIMLVAYQKMTNDILASLPAVDQALSIITIATGEDMSGAKIPQSQRFFDYMMLIAPHSLKQLISNNPLSEALENFTKQASVLTVMEVERLLEIIGIDEKRFHAVYNKLAETYTKYPKITAWSENQLKAVPEGIIKSETFKEIDKQIK